MVKILVTGSNGQLGNEIREIAKKESYFEFYFTDIVELDICDENAVNNYFEKIKPVWLINCAAYTAVDKAESDKDNAYKINCEAVKILSNVSKKYSTKFIHVSTDYVFDGTAFKPYSETDSVNPTGMYGLTKLQGEQAFMDSACSGMVIRTSWLYSSYGNNFVKTMIRLGKEKPELRVIFDQVGTPTYAADLAHSIIDIISKVENGENQLIEGIYHFSNEGVCSWYDFAKEILRQKNITTPVFPIESKDFPTPVKRPHYSVLNKAKIKSNYAIEIPHWTDSLKRCLEKLDK